MNLLKLFFDAVGIFFIIYLIGYSTFLFCSVVAGSSELFKRKYQKKLKNESTVDYYIPISIIVPAFNEEITVVDTVTSLLSLEYTLYEIIVIDDGSNDNTAQRMIDYFKMRQINRPIQKQIDCQPEEAVYETKKHKVPITLIRKKNSGKADSLNLGINAAQYPYFICIDADSMLQYDSLKKIVMPVIEDDGVVAVGGLIRISNGVSLENGHVVNYKLPKNILAAMQVIEYDRSFLASRILLDKFNGNMIISGAFGLFKKNEVILAGGYDNSTMGEDMELVVKLHVFCRKNKIPYRIKYQPNAICWSQAPENFNDLKKQRRRWHLGLFQSMAKHHEIFANPQYGAISFISFLYFSFYELLSPLIELFGIFTIVIAYLSNRIDAPFMILFYLTYTTYSVILSLTAFFTRIYTQDLKLSLRDVLKAILLCFVETCILRFIMTYIRATAFIGYNKNKLYWGKIQRKKMNIK